MTGYLFQEANLARQQDMRSRAAEHRLARTAAGSTGAAPAPIAVARSIAIRRAGEADRLALQRLAALDGVGARPGEMLIAEVDGEPLAAIHVSSGAAIADPFRPTGEVVELLRLRATRLREAENSPRRVRLRRLLRAA